MKKLLFTAVAFAGIIAGCGKLPEAELWRRAEFAYANKNADSSIQVCQKIIEEYPQGEITPKAMFMIADANINIRHDFRAAIAQYYAFIRKYPDQKKTPVALFQIGYLYNNELRMFDSAKVAYQDFVAKYPTHELKSSADFELLTMGKNPEELIKDEPPVKKQVARKGVK